ncbi:MAG: HPr-rel-A system PqqD family peptide chaperone [Halioglobus sp.]
MKWRIRSIGRYYDANESTIVYFDSCSGDTHLLSDFAAHVLQQFSDRPLTTEELVNHISQSMESGELAVLERSVSGVLEQLVALDILQRD